MKHSGSKRLLIVLPISKPLNNRCGKPLRSEEGLELGHHALKHLANLELSDAPLMPVSFYHKDP